MRRRVGGGPAERLVYPPRAVERSLRTVRGYPARCSGGDGGGAALMTAMDTAAVPSTTEPRLTDAHPAPPHEGVHPAPAFECRAAFTADGVSLRFAERAGH